MSARRSALWLTAAIGAACFIFAGSGLAGTSSISGSVPNGGCDADRSVPVSGPSRIEVSLSSTSADANSVIAKIVAPDGTVVATGKYDTPGGGNYAVRVCSLGSSQDSATIQYSGEIGTGPAGQAVLAGPAQPQASTDNSGVLGTTATINQSASGKGAIMTRSGLAWFTLHAVNGTATLRVYDPLHHVTRLVRGLHAAYGSSSVNVTGSGLTFVLVQKSSRMLITYRSPRFATSGKVVRGTFRIAI